MIESAILIQASEHIFQANHRKQIKYNARSQQVTYENENMSVIVIQHI